MEWFSNFIEPEVKFYPLHFQDHISAHKSNLESDLTKKLVASKDTLQPPPPMFDDSLFMIYLINLLQLLRMFNLLFQAVTI